MPRDLSRFPALAAGLMLLLIAGALGGAAAQVRPPSESRMQEAVRSVVGVSAEIPPGARGFNVAGALQGVSRRHCSIYRNGQGVIVEDHSSFGTFVNGARVQGRATLAAGDRVRIGTPGEELHLITVT